jgi:uncharacterized membrane protein
MREAGFFLVGIFVLALLSAPARGDLYSVGSLSFTVASNGDAQVTQTLTNIDVRTPSVNVTIYAKTPQNLVATDNGGQILRYFPYYYGQYSNYTIDTLGASSVLIQYDTSELVNQSGGVWNFSIDTAYNYTLTLPAMITASPTPNAIGSVKDPSGLTILTMAAGKSHVVYVFDVASGTALTSPLIGGILGVSGGSLATYLIIRRRKERKIDSGRVIRAHPELRGEEQEVVNFLAQKNGEAMESEIREAFEKIPKTTMWRLLKRLEEAEVVTLEKAGNQNRVKLK